MNVLADQRHVSRCSFTFFVFATLAAVVPAQTDNESLVPSPSPWPYYLQVYPGTNPSGETSVGIKSLYFALMMSFGGDFRSSGTIPGVQVALDQINSDPTLLPGYQLHYTLTDSQVCASYIVCCSVKTDSQLSPVLCCLHKLILKVWASVIVRVVPCVLSYLWILPLY